MIRRAVVSVYEKGGVLAFARALVDEFGIEIISTGGTARHLQAGGVAVTLVESLTGFPEMLDGRVKTLHPRLHAGILADRSNPEHRRQLAEQGIEPIDMVVVSLYPFEKTVAAAGCTFERAIEMIDIGGPCMLRAAAKNHGHVLVVGGAEDYGWALEQLRRWDDPAVREAALRRGGLKAFEQTAAYDAAVSSWLAGQARTVRTAEPTGARTVRMADDTGAAVKSDRVLRLRSGGELRYGENPHQRGELLGIEGERVGGIVGAARGSGIGEVELSYNNCMDASAALGLCGELHRAGSRLTENAGGAGVAPACCVFIKHTNACGAGVASEPEEAYRRAYLGDPNAAMGGILACSFAVDAAFARAVMETYDRWGKSAGAGGFFVEVWIAPRFEDEAVEVIRRSKKWGERVRLVPVSDMSAALSSRLEYRSIAGGLLAQSADGVGLEEDQWKVVTGREPTAAEWNDLRLAWLVCKHTKSNAITVCRGGMLLGNGAGQMSRVMSCRIATWLAEENGHGGRLAGSAGASDAFFPFADGPRILMDAGVTALIQPGGSKRDADTIAACDERGAAMVFTGVRHFRH